jgi:glycolate oxidase
MVPDYGNPEVREKADAALNRLFKWVLDHGGAITGEHGVGLAKQPWIRQALGENTFNLHRAIKGALDPDAILNPGKFLD